MEGTELERVGSFEINRTIEWIANCRNADEKTRPKSFRWLTPHEHRQMDWDCNVEVPRTIRKIQRIRINSSDRKKQIVRGSLGASKCGKVGEVGEEELGVGTFQLDRQ